MDQHITGLAEYGLLGLMLAISLGMIFVMVRWIAKRFETDIRGGFSTIAEKLQALHDESKKREDEAKAERNEAIRSLTTALDTIRSEIGREIDELRDIANRNAVKIESLEDRIRQR